MPESYQRGAFYPEYSSGVPSLDYRSLDPGMRASEYASIMHGYPSQASFRNPIDASQMSSDPLKAGLQMGLVGAAIGMSPSALRAIMGRNVSGGNTARNVILGAMIGSSLGLLSSTARSKTPTKHKSKNWEDVSKKTQERVNRFNPASSDRPWEKQFSANTPFEKQSAIGVTTAGILLALQALSAGWAGLDAWRAGQRAKKYKKLDMDDLARQARGTQAGNLALLGTDLAFMGAPTSLGPKLVSKLPWLAKIPGLARMAGRANKAKQVATTGSRLTRAARSGKNLATSGAKFTGAVAAPIALTEYSRAREANPSAQQEFRRREWLQRLKDSPHDFSYIIENQKRGPFSMESLTPYLSAVKPYMRSNQRSSGRPAAGTVASNGNNRALMPQSKGKGFNLSGLIRRLASNDPVKPTFTPGVTSWAT